LQNAVTGCTNFLQNERHVFLRPTAAEIQHGASPCGFKPELGLSPVRAEDMYLFLPTILSVLCT